MYLRQIIASGSIFGILVTGGYMVNNHLTVKEQQKFNMSPVQYEQMSTSADTAIIERPVELPTYKPREYVKIGATNYVISEGKSILEENE